jgi:hypothetical protein
LAEYWELFSVKTVIYYDEMAAAAMDAAVSIDNQPQCCSAESSVDCENCIIVKEQLHSALLYLKTAEKIIFFYLVRTLTKSMPPKVLNSRSRLCLMNRVHMNLTGGKWIPVVHSFNKKKKTPTVSAMANEQSYMSSNRFTPLTNLNENQADEVNLMSNCEWSSATNSMKKKPLFNLVPVIKYLR